MRWIPLVLLGLITACGTEHGNAPNPLIATVDAATGQQGPKGDKGDTGPQGATGDAGPKGDKGDRGDKGAMGQQGPQGAQGIQGPKGDTAQVNEWVDPLTGFEWFRGADAPYASAVCLAPYAVPTQAELDGARLRGIYGALSANGLTTIDQAWYVGDGTAYHMMTSSGVAHPKTMDAGRGTTLTLTPNESQTEPYTFLCIKK